ncbi:MAG: class I SAM-dependent methyltransferase [Chthoniobacterales bacterium]
MKFGHKVAKIAQPLTYRRAWRKAKRVLHPLPLAPLLAKVDQKRLAELRAEHLEGAKAYAAYRQHYVKYLDVERHLQMNIHRVQDLGLHRSSPKDVLDIGCGGGFFLFILQQLGHTGLGIDTNEIPMFTDIVDLLGVKRKIAAVRAFEPLPDLGRKFDWITGYSTAFHGSVGQSWRWGVPEWTYFLDDLRRHLKPGGRIFFGLNPAYDGGYYTPEILHLFLARGAQVERENVLFPPA